LFLVSKSKNRLPISPSNSSTPKRKRRRETPDCRVSSGERRAGKGLLRTFEKNREEESLYKGSGASEGGTRWRSNLARKERGRERQGERSIRLKVCSVKGKPARGERTRIEKGRRFKVCLRPVGHKGGWQLFHQMESRKQKQWPKSILQVGEKGGGWEISIHNQYHGSQLSI